MEGRNNVKIDGMKQRYEKGREEGMKERERRERVRREGKKEGRELVSLRTVSALWNL